MTARTCKTSRCKRPVKGRALYCDEHRPRQNRARDLRSRAAKGDAEAKQQLAEMGGASVDATASQMERFALFLGSFKDDVELAAQAAGLGVRGDALKRLAKQAKAKHRDHYDGKPEVAARHLQEAQILLALRVRDSVSEIPPNLIGSTLKQVTDALQTTTGGGGMIYGSFTVVLDGPDEKETEEWLEATGADPEALEETW